jgi:hypothetical protein
MPHGKASADPSWKVDLGAAYAGVTPVIARDLTTNVIPAQAGTQCTRQRGPALHRSDDGATSARRDRQLAADIVQYGLGRPLAEA